MHRMSAAVAANMLPFWYELVQHPHSPELLTRPTGPDDNKVIMNKMEESTPPVQSSMKYLARLERYHHEKPYSFSFDVSGVSGAEETNRVIDEQNVFLHQILELKDAAFDTAGWTFIEEPLITDPTTLTDPEIVRQQYYPEIENLIRRHFPQYDHVALIDHEVSQMPYSGILKFQL
jgi:hypothetical protein